MYIYVDSDEGTSELEFANHFKRSIMHLKCTVEVCYPFYVWSFQVGTTTLVSDRNIKHCSLLAAFNYSLAHCQMLHIAIVVVVEAL